MGQSSALDFFDVEYNEGSLQSGGDVCASRQRHKLHADTRPHHRAQVRCNM